MRHPAVARVARDPRLLAIASGFLDAEPIPYRATLFEKSPQNNWLVAWHQDTALPLRERCDTTGWGPWSVKAGIIYARAPAAALSRMIALRLHIDDSDADNGPLRVIPGTHTLGILSDPDVQHLVAQSQPLDCIVAAGGVLAVRPLTLHASSKAESDRSRRVLHIEYADSVQIGDGLELAIA
jgi:ectoine hydroxylase-related dioxygenase (phytanoyl-CoA dioxygenase family)